MSVQLVDKGVNVALKDSQGESLKNVMIGLGWDMKGGQAVDVDASVLMLKGGRVEDGGKAIGERNALCYFGCKTLPGLSHGGDNRTGAGSGDDERIKVMLDSIPTEVTSLGIFVDIYAGAANFGSVSNVKASIYDNQDVPNTDAGLATAKFKTDLSEDFSGFKAVCIGEFYRHDGAWKYKAIGLGIQKSLRDGGLNQWE